MGATDWLVIAGGIAAILWVNWYFFLAQRGSAAAGGRQDPEAESNGAP
ncbi:MAG: hypothetical protein ACJ79S_08675 [Gemmatimonadaceae bacterium]